MNTTRRSVIAVAVSLSLPIVAVAKNPKHLMEEQTFWKLVEGAKSAAGSNPDARPLTLEAQLSSLSLDELGAFQRRYESYLILANSWALWGAAYLMNGGSSDDGFKYFRDWLISEGRAVYQRALNDPESLSTSAPQEYFELEAFGYAALKVFARKGGGELDRDFNVELAEPTGKQWKESELPQMFPKLAARFKNR